MAKQKEHWYVFAQHYVDYEDHTDYHGWEYVGDTWAVSKAQAINNVRYHKLGKNTSQYMPSYISGHFEVGYNWDANTTGKTPNGRA